MVTVFEACINGQKISSNTCVKLPFVGKAYIYGFAIYDDDIFTDIVCCPPLGVAYVVGNRILFSLENKIYRFPIFSSIEKPAKEKYPVYLLYVPRLLSLPYSSHVAAYVETMKKEKPHLNIYKVDGIKLEDKKPYYFPKEDEFYFKSSSQLGGIANTFVVITRRISPHNGNLIYEVFDPNEVEIIEECANDCAN